jgi:hypothetical protein
MTRPRSSTAPAHSSTEPVHPRTSARIGHTRAVDMDVDAPARQRKEVTSHAS